MQQISRCHVEETALRRPHRLHRRLRRLNVHQLLLAPPALSLVPVGAYSYTDTEINLSGLYALIKRIATSVLP